MRIELDVAGDKQLAREVLRLGDRAVDATPAFAKVVTDLAEHERRQFETEGGLASGGWTPLAASTIAAKRAAGLDPRILRATGALYRSLTQPLGGGSDAIREVRPDEMRFGTSLRYARFHQLGTDRMPQRREIELRERDRADVVKTLQRYILTGEL